MPQIRITLRSENPAAFLENDFVRVLLRLRALGIQATVEPAPEGSPETTGVEFLQGVVRGIEGHWRPKLATDLPDPPPVTPEVVRELEQEARTWKAFFDVKRRELEKEPVHWITTSGATACGKFRLHDLEAHFEYVSVDASWVTCPGCIDTARRESQGSAPIK